MNADETIEICKKCGEVKAGIGIEYATETEPEKKYKFCEYCYAGW